MLNTQGDANADLADVLLLIGKDDESAAAFALRSTATSARQPRHGPTDARPIGGPNSPVILVAWPIVSDEPAGSAGKSRRAVTGHPSPAPIPRAC
jgi:hypothetical protein